MSYIYQFFTRVEFTIAYFIVNKCLIHDKLLPFNFFHSSFCAVEHGLQVTDLSLILYDNGATITRTNPWQQHTSNGVTGAMCMHGCITECYLIFTDCLTIQGQWLLGSEVKYLILKDESRKTGRSDACGLRKHTEKGKEPWHLGEDTLTTLRYTPQDVPTPFRYKRQVLI